MNEESQVKIEKMPSSRAGVTNMGRMGSDIETRRELKELRQDCNILAQHLNAIRKETQEKFLTLSNTSNSFENSTQEVLGIIQEKLNAGEIDMYSQSLAQIIKEDSAASRKQLFEDIERAIAMQPKISNNNSSSMIHWIIDIFLFMGIAIALFIA